MFVTATFAPGTEVPAGSDPRPVICPVCAKAPPANPRTNRIRCIVLSSTWMVERAFEPATTAFEPACLFCSGRHAGSKAVVAGSKTRSPTQAVNRAYRPDIHTTLRHGRPRPAIPPHGADG